MKIYEIATRVFGRLTKSVFVAIAAVVGGVFSVYLLQDIGDWLLTHQVFSFHLMRQNLYLSTIAFGIPSLIFGLPIQAFLQKIGGAGLLSNLAAAVLVGFPIGIWWSIACLGIFDDDEKQSFLSQLHDTFMEMKDWHSTGWSILFYLVVGALIFWLLRRPDKDVKQDAGKA